MPERHEYRLKIDGYLPETMPMRALVDYLSDVAVLFGEDAHVHLIKIEASSVSPVVLVDWDAEPKVLDRVQKAKNREGPEEAVRAIDSINARLRDDNTSANLISPTNSKVIEFPGAKIKPVKPIEWPSINQAGTLFGIPIAVGGKNDPVPVHLQDGASELNLLAERTKAKAIAQYLFTTVLRVTGNGRWRKASGGGWSLERFVVDDFEPVRLATIQEATAQLRAIDAQWKHSDDPLSALEEIRNGEVINPNGGIR